MNIDTGLRPIRTQADAAEYLRERQAKINREKAERIAAETLRLNYGDDAPDVRDRRPIQLDPSELVALIEAAALAALTEKENA